MPFVVTSWVHRASGSVICLGISHTYQPSRFLLDKKILPIPPENLQIPIFCSNLWCIMPIHFEWTHSIFKQKYSKSSKFDTFLKQRFICRLVGMISNKSVAVPRQDSHPCWISLGSRYRVTVVGLYVRVSVCTCVCVCVCVCVDAYSGTTGYEAA